MTLRVTPKMPNRITRSAWSTPKMGAALRQGAWRKTHRPTRSRVLGEFPDEADDHTDPPSKLIEAAVGRDFRRHRQARATHGRRHRSFRKQPDSRRRQAGSAGVENGRVWAVRTSCRPPGGSSTSPGIMTSVRSISTRSAWAPE